MLPKKAKKSNTKNTKTLVSSYIGIFNGKSATFNLAILETLFSDELTTWQIAKNLQKTLKPKKQMEIGSRIRHIYSDIQRKTGRLNDLKAKGYLKEENKIWSLTYKAYIALYAKKPELFIKQLKNESLMEKDAINYFRKVIEGKSENTFGISVPTDVNDKMKFLHDLEKLENNLGFVKKTLNESIKLISNGIELDRISESNLLVLAINTVSLKFLSEMKLGFENSQE